MLAPMRMPCWRSAHRSAAPQALPTWPGAASSLLQLPATAAARAYTGAVALRLSPHPIAHAVPKGPRSSSTWQQQQQQRRQRHPLLQPLSLPGRLPLPTTAAAAAAPSSKYQLASAAMEGGAYAAEHLLVTCTAPQDRASVEQAAGQVAEASSGAGRPVLLHFDAASLRMAAGGLPAFDAAACQAALRSKRLGHVLLSAAQVGSTQDIMRGYGAMMGDAVTLVADRQVAGKGRGGNQWTSPDGCLMFTAARPLRVQAPSQAPFINYLVCLAVTRGVQAVLQQYMPQGVPPPPVRIKWPNDIYAGSGLKIGGALIHTTWQRDRFNVVVGIGLNITNQQPTTCLQALAEAACVAHGTQPPAQALRREQVLAAVLSSLEDVFEVFEAHGFAPLEPEYLATWLHSGQELAFEDTSGTGADAGGGPAAAGSGQPRLVRLTVAGLSPSGFLLARDAAGASYELTPDGNSLDMMQGLIRRKLM